MNQKKNYKPTVNRVKQFTKRHKSELKKYKEIFKDDKKFEAIYLIVNSIVDTKSSQKLSVREVSKQIDYPAHKINYFLKRYREEGISSLIDYEQLVIQFLKQCGRPISEWTKSSMYEYVNIYGIVIQEERIDIPRSETFYFNILQKMKGWPDLDYTEIINKTYDEREDNNYQTIYIDYVKVPCKPNKLLSRPTYFYIIASNHELMLKKVNIHNETMKCLNIDIEVFSDIYEYLKSSYNNTMVILSDNEINRVIAYVYSSKKVLVTIGKSSKLREGIQQGLKYLSDIKSDLENEMDKLETAKTRASFIEQHRRKYKDIKRI